ncbi:MAG: hypothetical protein LUF78_01745 [Clostridiales bacterium]|nr:hypothetical protein [Clostridiales bacterium]
MKMNHLKSLITAIAIFDMAYVSFAGAEDMICRIRKSRKKKEKEQPDETDFTEDDEDDLDCKWLNEELEEEYYDDEEELTEDTIRRAAHYSAFLIVTDTIFNLPEIRPLLRCLNYEEKEAASNLLSAYIGYLAKCAPDEEQTFPVLMELLNATNADPESHDLDAAGQLLEDSAEEDPVSLLYLMDYRNYQATLKRFDFVDKRRAVEACQVIIRIVMVKLGIHYIPEEAEGTVM